jgi:hypothetical protein
MDGKDRGKGGKRGKGKPKKERKPRSADEFEAKLGRMTVKVAVVSLGA